MSACSVADCGHPWTPGRRYDVNDFVSLKAQMNLASEPGMSHGMLDVDLKARCRPTCLHTRACLEGDACILIAAEVNCEGVSRWQPC